MVVKTVVIIALTTILSSCFQEKTPKDQLREDIKHIIKNKDADVGVAIYNFTNGDTITVQKDKQFPMQSIFKFHIALAILKRVDSGELSLDQIVKIDKKILQQKGWSPIRDKYPNRDLELPLIDILEYTVALSDNIGADILINLIGGVKTLESDIKNLGINEISIKFNEEEMQKDLKNQFSNWTTPYAMAKLLHKFYRGDILSEDSFNTLWKIMLETKTGKNRIKGKLPKEAVVAHKTGTSGVDTLGVTAATNDIGIVSLPKGDSYAIVLFVANSKENRETNEEIMADISEQIWIYTNNYRSKRE